jgi:hypothetical protein
MEHFFKPTQCFLPVYTEVQLAVSIEAFLNNSWDWSDFRAYFTGDGGDMGRIKWVTAKTYIWIEDNNTRLVFDRSLALQRATFTTRSGETHDLVLAKRRNSGSLFAGVSRVFWHAVTTNTCVKLKLRRSSFWLICSGPALSQFLEASLSLELLEFVDFTFSEEECRALATLQRTRLEFTFEDCSFDAQDAVDTFIEWLRHSQVVTKLDNCMMSDNVVSALSGNSSVKSLSIDVTQYEDVMPALAGVLSGNQGICKSTRVTERRNTESPFALLVGAASNKVREP